METPIDRLRRCKLFGGNQTELAVYGGKWGVPNERDKNEVVRDFLEVDTHAKRLMAQVMETWGPPLQTGSERPADIAQTSTMLAIAYIMGREFLPTEMTDNQRAAIESGLKLFNEVLEKDAGNANARK